MKYFFTKPLLVESVVDSVFRAAISENHRLNVAAFDLCTPRAGYEGSSFSLIYKFSKIFHVKLLRDCLRENKRNSRMQMTGVRTVFVRDAAVLIGAVRYRMLAMVNFYAYRVADNTAHSRLLRCVRSAWGQALGVPSSNHCYFAHFSKESSIEINKGHGYTGLVAIAQDLSAKFQCDRDPLLSIYYCLSPKDRVGHRCSAQCIH